MVRFQEEDASNSGSNTNNQTPHVSIPDLSYHFKSFRSINKMHGQAIWHRAVRATSAENMKHKIYSVIQRTSSLSLSFPRKSVGTNAKQLSVRAWLWACHANGERRCYLRLAALHYITLAHPRLFICVGFLFAFFSTDFWANQRLFAVCVLVGGAWWTHA